MRRPSMRYATPSPYLQRSLALWTAATDSTAVSTPLVAPAVALTSTSCVRGAWLADQKSSGFARCRLAGRMAEANKKAPWKALVCLLCCLAEGAGFEPAVGY